MLSSFINSTRTGLSSKYLIASVMVRCISSNPKTEKIVITDDGSTIVCWHPEKPFPYECSKPIPENVVEETNSVLKIQSLSEVYDVFKQKSEEQTREELMKITHSTKHIWFPPAKKTYKKKPWPKNREHL